MAKGVGFVELVADVLGFSNSRIFKDDAIIGDATTFSDFEEIFKGIEELISNAAACREMYLRVEVSYRKN